MKLSQTSQQHGAALLAVYWTIGILSLAVFTTSQLVLFEVKTSSNEELVFRAELLADSAIALAANQMTSADDSILQRELSESESYSATIRSEGGRLNLNAILNPNDRAILVRLFESWGIPATEASSIADSIIDWVDSDDLSTNKGWEQQQYLRSDRTDQTGIPFNRPFQDLDEVPLVAGFQRVIAANPRWKEVFTLRSSGKLDLTSAPPDLIAIVCDCTPETAAEFVESRNGLDGIPFTEDDIPFQNTKEALDMLRRGGSDHELLDRVVTVNDPITRIVGVGRSGDVIVERAMILQGRETQRPIILDLQTTATFLRHEPTE